MARSAGHGGTRRVSAKKRTSADAAPARPRITRVSSKSKTEPKPKKKKEPKKKAAPEKSKA